MWYDVYDVSEYVNANVRLDQTLDDVPWNRLQEIEDRTVEMHAIWVTEETRRRQSNHLAERQEERDVRAAELAAAPEPVDEVPVADAATEEDPTVFESRACGEHLVAKLTANDSFLTDIKSGYEHNLLFVKVLKQPDQYTAFTVRDQLIWSRNRGGEQVLCMPLMKMGSQSLHGVIIDQAHTIVGHFGPQHTADYIRQWYWWPQIHHKVQKFCNSCQVCLKAKESGRPPQGLLHSLPIPTQPWQSIGMDFIGPFPEVDSYNYLWVVICRMINMVHLILVNTKMTASQLSWIYLKEVVRLHGLPTSIVSDRDSKFTSKWWRELHRLMGAKLLMLTSFHPQTDGVTERANCSIGQLFRAAISPDQKDWVYKIPMMEFTINASISKSTGFTPFELDGAYMPTMICQLPESNTAPPGMRTFTQQALQNIAAAHEAIIASRVFQRHYANTRRHQEPTIKQEI